MNFVVGFVGNRYYHITDTFPSMRCVSLDSTVSVPPALTSLHCGPRCLLFLRSLIVLYLLLQLGHFLGCDGGIDAYHAFFGLLLFLRAVLCLFRIRMNV